MSSLSKFYIHRAVGSLIPTATASTAVASALLLSACGGGSSSGATAQSSAPPPPATITMSGVVAASGFIPGSKTGNAMIKAGYYQGAIVCVDQNGNGKCDAGEPQASTDGSGKFSLTASALADVLADIGTTATNTATGTPVTGRLALRASHDQVSAGATTIVISPMSSEVQRLVEANSSSYATEKANLATRLGVTADVLADVSTVTGTDQTAMLAEYNVLANRYAYATLKFDRGDLYPDALAVAGNDPELASVVGISAATAPTAADTRKAITFQQAQQAAFNIEGVPRYDAIFIVMLENKGTNTIAGSPYAPNINAYLNAGNQFTTYFATGNPSEPNYTALGGADDWGITDDNWWGCGAIGSNAPTDAPFAGGTASDGQPLPAYPALPVATVTDSNGASHSLSPGGTACVTTPSPTNVNHNIQGVDSLFTLISKAGLTWRIYSESMNPGQDPRTDSSGDPAVSGTFVGAGSVDLKAYVAPDGLYKTKHNPGMAYQTTRNLPEFFADSRTIFGTQYSAAVLSKSSVYPIPAAYNYDQFSTDLTTGEVGNFNFIVPDQCDDMHGVGTDPSCAGNFIVLRGDDYVRQVVEKIQASPLWKNPRKHVAVVLMFDEGKATFSSASSPYNSCCGWVPGAAASLVNTSPLTVNVDGTVSVNSSVADYGTGNHGHGNSIFGVLTNQGPTGIKDSDVYSHFSFVRTLQDMFQLADPAKDGSYLARAKYTEKFIAQNILNLPEYAGSADTHFDSVRPMNHAYVIPASYAQKQSTDISTAPQIGPDANQTNAWAVK